MGLALKEGGGADAAWYRSALLLREEAALEGRPFSGACDDILKAYDGVQRELAIAVACVAGFPRQLAKTYVDFQQGLLIRPCTGVGSSPHQDLVHTTGLSLE